MLKIFLQYNILDTNDLISFIDLIDILNRSLLGKERKLFAIEVFISEKNLFCKINNKSIHIFYNIKKRKYLLANLVY